MTKTSLFNYLASGGAILFAAVGFITGWANSAECLTVLLIGLNGLGIHMSNVQLGRALGRIN